MAIKPRFLAPMGYHVVLTMVLRAHAPAVLRYESFSILRRRSKYVDGKQEHMGACKDTGGSCQRRQQRVNLKIMREFLPLRMRLDPYFLWLVIREYSTDRYVRFVIEGHFSFKTFITTMLYSFSNPRGYIGL